MSETIILSEAKIKGVVDNYKAVIAASHRLIEDPGKWELHNFARVLIGVDNGTDERYHSLTPEKKLLRPRATGSPHVRPQVWPAWPVRSARLAVARASL